MKKKQKTPQDDAAKKIGEVAKHFPKEVAWIEQNVKANSIAPPQTALALLIFSVAGQLQDRTHSRRILTPLEWNAFQEKFSHLVAEFEKLRENLTEESTVTA